MTILSGIPVLNCQSIEVTLDFYQQALQFVIVKKRESAGELQWVHLMNGGTTLMLQRAPLSMPRSGESKQNNINLYFYISDINTICHFLKVKYSISIEISTTQYQMRECELCDPEGNNITLGQKAESQSEVK